MEYAQADIQTIAVSGAVGRALWQALLSLAASQPGLRLVVADGTRLFVEAADLAAFAQLGGQLLAYRGIQIIGLTLNPFSPLGGSFEAQAFLDAAREAFPNYGVSDVMLEEQNIAEWGSDPNSGDKSQLHPNGITELGSDPYSADHAKAAS